MKKYNLNLKENEELIVDVDDLMETELVKFKEVIKDLSEEEIRLFNNWIKIYKLLNYDIIDDLEINNVYKFSVCSAIIELTFRGSKEYDIINLNPETMTVACMNVKQNSIRPYIVRRLLIPDTVEDALSFAKSEIPNEGIKAIAKTMNELENNKKRCDVTSELNLDKNEFERIIINTEPEKPKQVEEPEVIERTVLPQYRKETIRPPKKEEPRTVLPQYRKETIRPPKKSKPEPEKVRNENKSEPKKVKEYKVMDVIFESIKDDGGFDVNNLFAKLR